MKNVEEYWQLSKSNTEDNENWLTDRVYALNSSPKDVTGAGDCLLITSILSYASGGNIWESSLLGSLSAGIHVGRVGNIPLEVKELLLELS